MMMRAAVIGLLVLLLLAGCRGSGKSGTITAATPSATIESTAAVMISTPESTSVATPAATPRVTATPRTLATPRAFATPVASPQATPTVDLGVRRTPTPTGQVKAQLAKNVTSDYQPVDPTTSFSVDSAKIYLAFTTIDIPGESTLSSIWVAEKVDANVAANYVIDRAEVRVTGSQSGDFSLSRPNAGFPSGSYRVDLYLNGALVGSYPFTVK